MIGSFLPIMRITDHPHGPTEATDAKSTTSRSNVVRVSISKVNLRGWLIAIIAIALGLAVLVPIQFRTGAGAAQAAASPGFFAIPVTPSVRPVSGDPTLIVQITVGGSDPIPVQVDTGSTGLHVFSSALRHAHGIEYNGQPFTETYGDDTQFIGKVARAPITVGGVASKAPVEFDYVTHVGCAHSSTSCSGADGPDTYYQDEGVQGVMGVSMSHSSTYSPLTQLVPGVPDTYTISLTSSDPSIIFNSTPTTGSTFSIPASSTPTQANGANAWNDQQINACWAYGASTPSCVPTVFDTGAVDTSTDSSIPGAPAAGGVPPGMVLNLTTPAGGAVWNLTAGTNKGTDEITVEGHAGDDLVNSGYALFRQFDVTFNVTDGTATLTPLGSSPRPPASTGTPANDLAAGAPAAPTITKVTTNNQGATVQFAPGDTTADSFIVRAEPRSGTNGGNSAGRSNRKINWGQGRHCRVDGSKTKCVFTDLPRHRLHRFTVVARNEHGRSERSDPVLKRTQ